MRPIPGYRDLLQFTGGRHQVITIRTSTTGTFSGVLPAGRYSVSYRSPRLLEGSSASSARQYWSQPVPVVITPHHTTKITLTAIVP